MKICVCGLGYVGSVTAACLAKAGHTVIGVDINADKVRLINAGTAPVVEAGLTPLFAEMAACGRLWATTDLQEAVAQSDATLIAVGTPSRHNGSLDTCALEHVCTELGRALRQRETPHTIIIRSTVLPGTTRTLLIPLLEEAAGRTCDDRMGVCYNPEFMREGTSLADFYTPPFTILGYENAGHGEVAKQLYACVDAPLETTTLETAEMLKYACNAFHALKVSFANEIGDFACEHGVDGREVMRLLCLDRKLNIAPTYLRPGFAFGGSCLPKDLRALLYRARQRDLPVPLLGSILTSNAAQLQRGLDMIYATGKSRIGLLGLTFKNGTDDLRESPNVALAEALLGKGYDLRIHDAYLNAPSAPRLTGANRSYIECHLPHFARLLAPLPEVLEHAEVIVVGVNNPDYAAALAQHSRVPVIDLVSLKGVEPGSGTQVRGIAW